MTEITEGSPQGPFLDDSGRSIDGDVIKLSFRLDAIREHVKRIWDAIQGESMQTVRGPDPDYEAPEDDIADRVIRVIERKYGPPRHVHYTNGDHRNGNGEKRLLTWILGVLALLLVGGVGSVVGMYGKLSSIEEGQRGHEQRINRLEQERDRLRSASPNAQ